MNPHILAEAGAGPINLDQPGTYLHWSIFYVSMANLVLIGVMVVIFGLALVLPFPKGRTYPAEESAAGPLPGDDATAGAGSHDGRTGDADTDEADRDMWTNRA